MVKHCRQVVIRKIRIQSFPSWNESPDHKQDDEQQEQAAFQAPDEGSLLRSQIPRGLD